MTREEMKKVKIGARIDLGALGVVRVASIPQMWEDLTGTMYLDLEGYSSQGGEYQQFACEEGSPSTLLHTTIF